MRVVAVIQARFSSRRLPGKVLLPLRGRPLLAHVLDSLASCRTLDGVVVATSTEPSDDAVARFASEYGVACFRGALDDVACRLLDAGRSSGADSIVRVNSDSPLLDPVLVDHGVGLFRAEPVDLVTNAYPRSFPKGQGVEVIALAALGRALRRMGSEAEREHVTQHFYVHSGEYMIRSFAAANPRPEVQLSVDDAADFARCEAIISALGRPSWVAGWEACVDIADALNDRQTTSPVESR